jgi:hypothetical protein
MSAMHDLVKDLKTTADTVKPDNKYLFELLSNASETIADLSAKLYEQNMTRSNNYYKGKISCWVKINNLPLHDWDKYIVARVDGTELWYYGTYDNEYMAYRVADEIGNGIVVEVGE